MVGISITADSQEAILYNNDDWLYEVKEPGGTTNDDRQHGGRAFKVSIIRCDWSTTGRCNLKYAGWGIQPIKNTKIEKGFSIGKSN